MELFYFHRQATQQWCEMGQAHVPQAIISAGKNAYPNKNTRFLKVIFPKETRGLVFQDIACNRVFHNP
jgi:hypothetical protein